MRKLLSKFLGSVGLALALLVGATSANAIGLAVCDGKTLNPMSDLDWNLMYPITVAGARMTSGKNLVNPPLMEMMPPTCFCPTYLGYSMFGIGVTYWEPVYVAEIERRPGCLTSIGGQQVLDSYAMLHSEGTADEAETEQTNRMQIHWYYYPVMQMLDMYSNTWCRNPSGFDLAYMTEIDPTWQDDSWGSVFTPEDSLFATLGAQLACAFDAVAANVYAPLDFLFWCSGSWGNTYPLTGNAGHNTQHHQQNNQIVSKFIARQARLGLEFNTIGPLAVCGSYPSPVWLKSQYRYNQVGPVVRKGKAVTTGDLGLLQFPTVTNAPTQEHTVNVIWNAKYCCLKPIP